MMKYKKLYENYKMVNVKSSGFDIILNEILKNKEVIMCLWYLYRKCFFNRCRTINLVRLYY